MKESEYRSEEERLCENEKIRYRKIARRIKYRRAAIAAASVCFAILVFAAAVGLFQRAVVSGTSMEPTVHDQETYILNKWIYRISDPDRYDIIIYELKGICYITRIAGLPGESVKIEDGRFYVNGSEQVGFSDIPAECELPERTLADGEYLVMPDNRAEMAETDRIIRSGDIAGKVWITH